MVKLKTMNYINNDDVEELTGCHFGNFEFVQMVANDSFAYLGTSDGELEELYEDYEWEAKKEGNLTAADFEDEDEWRWHCRNSRAVRLKNQIKLVEILRKQYGVRDGIYVYISW